MTRKELDKLIGKLVEITFKDGDIELGVLGFTTEYSAKYHYRKPNYYTINNIDFKVTHIKKAIERG